MCTYKHTREVESTGCAHQEILVYLQVSIELSEVSGSVQRCQTFVVPLVDFSPVVQQVVQHIELLVCRCKVYGGSSTVVLRQEVWVDRHNME